MNEKIKKVLKPVKIAVRILNPISREPFIDRIMPPGTEKRLKYDQEQTKLKYEKKVENYFKLTDNETAEYWKGIDHRYFLKYEKDLENEQKDNLTDYEKWMKLNDLTENELDLQTKAKLRKKPKISIVVPLYNTDTDFFRELLYSVHCQTYSNWELCLADGSPKELSQIKKMCEKDDRIKYVFLNENRGISGNSNAALDLATGDFVALLDHDDMLPLNALYEIVKVINQNKNVEFIYSDEDKFHFIDESRFEPHFKPDFAIDTVRANNYICHFSVFKKSLIDKIGGFNSEFDGSQDYDIILRAIENAKKIVHIPKVLYHWRVHKDSTAMNQGAKPYTLEAGKKAIKAHLERAGADGNVEFGAYPGMYEVIYDIKNNPKVSIILEANENIDILKKCVNSILDKTTYENYEIVIIQNGKLVNKLSKEFKQNNKIRLVSYDGKNMEVFEFEVKQCENSEFIVKLSASCEILTCNWLEKMIGFCRRPEVGLVAPKMYFEDGKINSAGMVISPEGASNLFIGAPKEKQGYFGRESLIQNLSCINLDCVMAKTSIFKEIQFSKEYENKDYRDIDFCLRARQQGKLIIYNPFVEIANTNKSQDVKFDGNSDCEKFKSKWKKRLNDEYYNANFDQSSNNYRLNIPKVNCNN